MTVYVLLAFISLFSSFVQSAIGFGYGMVAVVFLPVLFGSNADSASVITIVGIMQAAVLFVQCWREVRWRILLPLLLAFFVVMPTATYCTRFLPLLLGIILLLITVYFLLLKGKLQLKPTRSSAVAAGILSGTLSGFLRCPGSRPASI